WWCSRVAILRADMFSVVRSLRQVFSRVRQDFLDSLRASVNHGGFLMLVPLGWLLSGARFSAQLVIHCVRLRAALLVSVVMADGFWFSVERSCSVEILLQCL
ncbi:hypothetical protein NDU88_006099, partial [Pleurodeles waltl]